MKVKEPCGGNRLRILADHRRHLPEKGQAPFPVSGQVLPEGAFHLEHIGPCQFEGKGEAVEFLDDVIKGPGIFTLDEGVIGTGYEKPSRLRGLYFSDFEVLLPPGHRKPGHGR